MPGLLTSTVRAREPSGPVAEGLAALATCLARGGGGGAGLRRVTVPLPAVAPADWFRAQSITPSWYWQSRDGAMEMATVGVADALVAPPGIGSTDLLAQVADRLQVADEGIRYVGGMRFDEQCPVGPEWADFGGTQLFVPRLELVRRQHRFELAVNLFPGEEEEVLAWLGKEAETMSGIVPLAHGGRPAPARRADLPDRRHWRSNVQAALEAIEEGCPEKIVLARRAGFVFDEPLDVAELLQCLLDVSPKCFKFCLRLGSGRAFLGASPERLYARVQRHIESEAIAGTRPRALAAERDRKLAAELLSSEKDLREHYYVRDSLVDILTPCCETLTCDPEVSLLKLARKQHLYSGLHGRLLEGTGDAELVGALHPTPAVGGFPCPPALQRIRDWEPFDRGWYAAPVGWVSRDAAEWAVAIRSGLVNDNRLDLYSGAGIVMGSHDEQEWDEIEHKIADFIRILAGV